LREVDIGIWARDYQEIDVFNWQKAVANMITVSDLEVELAASEGVVRRAIEREEVRPARSASGSIMSRRGRVVLSLASPPAHIFCNLGMVQLPVTLEES
jgi:hypothetical protein